MEDTLSETVKKNGSIRFEVSLKKNHLISVFKSLEITLSDKKRKYADKTQALLSAWEQIVNFVSESSTESPQPEFDFLFINTLRFVLRGDWSGSSPVVKTHLKVTLQRFARVLGKTEFHHGVLEQCKVLESVVSNPWGHPILCKILNTHDVDLTECVQYFNCENGKVIVIRLEMLLQSKCEDIAVQLSKYCLQAYNKFNEDLEGFDTLDFTQNEVDYITDIYLSSLYKTKKKNELMDEIKSYQVDDGLRMLQRYRVDGVGGKYNENCKDARVWKYSKKLVELISNTLLANAVLHENIIDSQSQLEDLIVEWAFVYKTNSNDVLPPVALEMIRKFVLIAASSKCIYPFCSFLINNSSCKELDMNQVARCLIRAINQNMNEVEQFRVNQERDKLKETNEQLSKGFVLVSELFSKYEHLYKECLLTSFSITPSRECLQKIEAFVENRTKTGADACNGDGDGDQKSSTEDNAPADAEPRDSAAADPMKIEPTVVEKVAMATAAAATAADTSELNEIFESMGVAKSEPPLETGDSDKVNVEAHQPDTAAVAAAAAVNDGSKKGSGNAAAFIAEIESLTLDDSIRVDLNSILRYQRFHTLSWEIEWHKLKANCEQYLQDFEKKGFDDVELKYLNLDYNQFKNQPINYDEYCGIEKGYEHYAYSGSSGDSEEEEEEDGELSSSGATNPRRKSGLSSSEFTDDELYGPSSWSSSSAAAAKKKRKRSNPGERRGRRPSGEKKRAAKRRNKSEAKARPDEDPVYDDDSILDSMARHESNPNDLKALRQFRITTLKPLNNSSGGGGVLSERIRPEGGKRKRKAARFSNEELNDILEASYKHLEGVEIPPISPSLEIYEILLNESTINECSILARRCPCTMETTETADDSSSSTMLAGGAEEVKEEPDVEEAAAVGALSKIEQKRKFFVSRERDPTKKQNFSNYNPSVGSTCHVFSNAESTNEDGMVGDVGMNATTKTENSNSFLEACAIFANAAAAEAAATVAAAARTTPKKNGKKVKNGDVLGGKKERKPRPKRPKKTPVFNNVNVQEQYANSMNQLNQFGYKALPQHGRNYPKDNAYGNAYQSKMDVENKATIVPAEMQNTKNVYASAAQQPDLRINLTDIRLENIENLLRMDCEQPPVQNNSNLMNATPAFAIGNTNVNGGGSVQQGGTTTNNDNNPFVINGFDQTLFDMLSERLFKASNPQMYAGYTNDDNVEEDTTQTEVNNVLANTFAAATANNIPTTSNANFVAAVAVAVAATQKPAAQQSADMIQKILGHYRDQFDRCPELRNTPAPRKRTKEPAANRKPRTKGKTKSTQSTVPTTAPNQYKNYSYLGAFESSQASMVNCPTNPQPPPPQSINQLSAEKNAYFANNSSSVYNAISNHLKSKLPTSYANTSSQMCNAVSSETSARNNVAARCETNVYQQSIGTQTMDSSTTMAPRTYSKGGVSAAAKKDNQPSSSTVKPHTISLLKKTLENGSNRGGSAKSLLVPAVVLPKCDNLLTMSPPFPSNQQPKTNVAKYGNSIAAKTEKFLSNQQPTRSSVSSFAAKNVHSPDNGREQPSKYASNATSMSSTMPLIMNNVSVPYTSYLSNSMFAGNNSNQDNSNAGMKRTYKLFACPLPSNNHVPNVAINIANMPSTGSLAATNSQTATNEQPPMYYATINGNLGEITNPTEVCISIPENANSESFFGNFLTLIQNNASTGESEVLPGDGMEQIFFSNSTTSKVPNYET